MSALAWVHVDGRAVAGDHRGSFVVRRHGEGRKYWGVTYPDGTYTHNARTQAEAKLQAGAWEPDETLVQLVDGKSAEPDDEFPICNDCGRGLTSVVGDGVNAQLCDQCDADQLDQLVDPWSDEPDDAPAAAAVASVEADDDAGMSGQDFLPDAGDDWQTAREKQDNLRRHRRSALECIPSLVAARASLDAQIAEMVERARLTSGSYYDYDRPTWEQIGKALGVTKQSAQAKYGKRPTSS